MFVCVYVWKMVAIILNFISWRLLSQKEQSPLKNTRWKFWYLKISEIQYCFKTNWQYLYVDCKFKDIWGFPRKKKSFLNS